MKTLSISKGLLAIGLSFTLNAAIAGDADMTKTMEMTKPMEMSKPMDNSTCDGYSGAQLEQCKHYCETLNCGGSDMKNKEECEAKAKEWEEMHPDQALPCKAPEPMDHKESM